MQHQASGRLFEAVSVGAIALRNRIVMAPLTRSRASPLGVPAAFAVDYYAQRAGAGLLITEASQISFEGMGYPRTAGIHEARQLAAWKAIVDAVHARGSRIVVQLWHVGRIAHRLNRGHDADVVAPSAIRAPGQIWTDQQGMQDHDMPRALESDEIARIALEYAAAARNAIDTGFDGVELHSANGYLLHQFLSSNVNRRTDRYGGSIANRVRMPLQALDAVVAEVGAERTGLRISPGHTFNDIAEDDMAELYAHYLGELEKRHLAYLHVMRPFANTIDQDVVALVRAHYRGKLMVCGGYDHDSAAAVVAQGDADAVAFGRAFISNPDLVERMRAGAPLAEADQATFYTPGEKGYTDYPPMSARVTAGA